MFFFRVFLSSLFEKRKRLPAHTLEQAKKIAHYLGVNGFSFRKMKKNKNCWTHDD
jgi:hypothetical protein